MTDPFVKGEVIRADDLMQMHRLASHGAGLPSAPGSGASIPYSPPGPGQYISVIGRGVNAPSAIVDHSYTILLPAPGGGKGDEFVIDWRNLIVKCAYSLVDPAATKNLSFVPSAVVGDAEWSEQPWRARGILYRPNGLDMDNKRYYMVELFGLAPVFGCGVV